MKGKNFLEVIFLLTLISSAVFGYVAENSCQGFAEISTISQPASDCENADLHRGSSLQNFNGMSGALYCAKHGKKKCGQCAPVITAEEYSYLPQDWRRVTRSVFTHDGQRCKHGYGYGHGRGHVCDEIPGHGNGHDRDGQNDETVYVSVYENQDESHEYLLKAGVCDAHNQRHEQHKCTTDQHKTSLELVRSFIGGPSTDDLEYTRQDHRSLSHLKDGLGSTIALTVKDGRPVARIGYDVWGNLRWPDKPGHSIKPCDDKDVPDWLDRFENGRSFGQGIDPWRFGRHHGKAITPYLYTGRRLDQFAGQYFNRNRYYSPKVGRFISRDPIGFSGGNNLWAYATNTPTRYKDPFGLDLHEAGVALENLGDVPQGKNFRSASGIFENSINDEELVNEKENAWRNVIEVTDRIYPAGSTVKDYSIVLAELIGKNSLVFRSMLAWKLRQVFKGSCPSEKARVIEEVNKLGYSPLQIIYWTTLQTLINGNPKK